METTRTIHERACAILQEAGIENNPEQIEALINNLTSSADELIERSLRHEVWILGMQQLATQASSNTDIRTRIGGDHIHALDALPRCLNQLYLQDQVVQAYSWLKADLLGGQSYALAEAVAYACAYFQPNQSTRLFESSDDKAHPIIEDVQTTMQDPNSVWALYVRAKQASLDMALAVQPLHARPDLLVHTIESLENFDGSDEIPANHLLNEIASLCIHVTSQSIQAQALSRQVKPFTGSVAEIEGGIAAWAASIRPSFDKKDGRRPYNFAVADALLGSGIMPSAASVLRVGRWGQSSSVADDFELWTKSLAKRVGEQELALPPPIRKQANDLLMTMVAYVEQDMKERFADPAWKGLQESRMRLAKILQDTQVECGRLANELAQAQELAQDNEAVIASLRQQAEQDHAKQVGLEQRLRDALDAAADLTREINKLKADHAAAMSSAVLAHEQAMGAIRNEHAQILSKRDQSHNASLRQVQIQLDAARQESINAKDQQIQAQSRVEQLSTQLAEEKLKSIQQSNSDKSRIDELARKLHELQTEPRPQKASTAKTRPERS